MSACIACGREIKPKIKCDTCCQKEATARKLGRIEKSFKPASEYNRQIFDLYLIYTKRNEITYNTCKQTQKLKDFLEKELIKPFLSWDQIIELEQKNPLGYSKEELKRENRPFRKIGYMLEELGVIGAKSDSSFVHFKNSLNYFDENLRPVLKEFIEELKKRKRSEATIIGYLDELRKLMEWIAENAPSHSFFTLSSEIFLNYCEYLKKKYPSSQHAYNTHHRLHLFYRWCCGRKKMLYNPMENIKIKKPLVRHTICSQFQFQKLLQYIKDPGTDPELAMMVSLVIFWAATARQLMHAQIDFSEEGLKIIFRKELKTYRTPAKRPQEFMLPQKPEWFLSFQKKFLLVWKERYARLKSTYPRKPLFMPYSLQHNRGVGRTWIASRIKEATMLATGEAIPLTVLRQTAAHLHLRGQDSSLLTALGWASNSALIYTWAPKTFFSPKKKKSKD